MASSAPVPGNSGRSAKLNKFFDSVVRGAQPLVTLQHGKLFIEAVCAQPDPPACIDKIVTGPKGSAILQIALRFNDSSDFQNGPATSLIKYIQSPSLKSIQGGIFLHQVVRNVVEPPFFWDPFLASFRNHILDNEAQQCFGWLLSEMLSLPGGAGASYLTVAQDDSIQTIFQSSQSLEVRNVGQKIKHIASIFDSSNEPESTYGPGGRHDNDFADFREIAIHPTADELMSEERPFLREAQEIDGPSQKDRRLALHIDNQFRLLREDMLTEMREEIQIIFGKKHGRHKGLVIDGLSLLDIECGDHVNRKPLPWGLQFRCKQDLRQLANLKPKARHEYMSVNRGIFKHQSLACFIIDDEIVSFPTIHRDLSQVAQKPPVITLQFTGKSSTTKSLLKIKLGEQIRLVQIDTAVFAFEPILKGLQELRDIPLTEEMLFWEPDDIINLPSHAPWQLIDRLQARPTQDLRDLLDLSKSIKLDASQFTSLLSGLKQRVSLIQGPPGTGKSFIGALIAKSIYQYTKAVILVVCFKNHALDQFLEDLLDIGIPAEQMVRLGGQSTPRTKRLQLYDQTGTGAKPAYKTLDELRGRAKALASEMRNSFGRYQATNLRQPDLMEYLEFSSTDSVYYEAFVVPKADDGSTRVGRRGKAVDEYYLLDRWLRGEDAGIFSAQVAKSYQYIWSLPNTARQSKQSAWKQAIFKEQVLELELITRQYNQSLSELERLRRTKDAQVIGSRRIVGCTTTAAAKYAKELQSASRDVILVEEAGEILESHILTTLASQTQQLILIGDHKQLRPKVNHDLSVEKGEGYDLNRSLFERLVLKGFPHQTLVQQHRMRPEISALVRSMTYPDLVDAPRTQDRDNIRGLRDNLVLLSHEHPEVESQESANWKTMSSVSSKQNKFEVDLVLKIVRYLGQQGYGTEDIVVLTPYLGQLRLLQTVLSKDNDPILNDLDSHDLVRAGLLPPASANASKSKIRLATIDNYQGEESKIVVASLTRSNNSGDIGFMAFPQRLNVLLSRARDSLIMVGNMKTFSKSRKGTEIWTKLFGMLKQGGHIYEGLPVKCERHPERAALLREPLDFEHECPDGGCNEPWNPPKDCAKCEKEAKRVQREMEHALELQEKRDREELEHANHMAKLDAMLASERQRIRDEQISEDRSHQIAQKERDLAQARKMAISRSIPEQPPQPPHAETDVKASNQDASPEFAKMTPKSNFEVEGSGAGALPQTPGKGDMGRGVKRKSPAKEDWEQQKRLENTTNDAIDSIMDMIGLEEVKTQVLLIKAKIDASQRQNSDPKQDRVNAAFLGNPGTGKTTVARLYAKVLTSLGLIPGDTFVETTGSRLANDGVPGIKKIIEELMYAAGGVLFVDEAYQMTAQHNHGGKQVLDFLLAEIENNIGKIVFIFAGYKKEMEKFFEHNPGIPSRIPYTFQFQDYKDDELLLILQQQITKRYRAAPMKIEDGYDGLYMRIAVRRLGRNRGRPGFGNARALQTLLSAILERQAGRLHRERKKGQRPDDFVLSQEDLIGPDPSKAILESQAWEKLQELTGLSAVKKSIKILINRSAINYARELKEKEPVEVSLNRVFLGSPGTGKTSVAKLYGQILADIGLLSNGEVVIKNPADFLGSALGQSEANTKAILSTTVGKVLIIDEAYSFYAGGSGFGNQSDIYRTAVVDTIVAEVQSVPGEDRCVLLLGYEEEMKTMFQNVNQGLSRRFAIESAFRFEDFTNAELLEILELKMRQQDLGATKIAKDVAIEVLSRARNRPKFGNAGEVENILSLAKGRHQERQELKTTGNDISDVVFEPQDFDPDYRRAENATTNLQALFSDVIGCEEVIDKLAGYQQIAHNLKSKGLSSEDLIPTNFLFKGPPGTGKTTTARKMGQVFFDLGMLAEVEVVECSASDLIGSYVGHTGPKTRAQLEKALGKVLFVDEAYRLSEGQFATEAINELVDLLTKPKFKGKLIVVLAGYEKDINNLISVNPGLSSRFPEQIVFQDLELQHCLELLWCSIQAQGIETPTLTDPQRRVHQKLTATLTKLASLPSWGNARDIKTLATTIIGSVYRKQFAPSEILRTSEDEIIKFAEAMLQERQDRVKNVPMNLKSELTDFSQQQKQANADAEPQKVANIDLKTSTTAKSASAPPFAREDSPPPLFPPEEEEVARRDVGVPDEIWKQLQVDIELAKAQVHISEEDIKKGEEELSASQAKEQQESHACSKVLAEKQAKNSAEVREIKQKQDEARSREEAARKAREIAKADLERMRLQRVKQKREEQVQVKLRQMGVCCMGYQWIKQSHGYRCAGGSHYVGNRELGL